MIIITVLTEAISALIGAVCLYLAYRILTRPEIERKHIIRNKIDALVESEKHFTSVDRLLWMKKQLDQINPEDVPEWQQHAYVNAVLEKFNFKGIVKKC